MARDGALQASRRCSRRCSRFVEIARDVPRDVPDWVPDPAQGLPGASRTTSCSRGTPGTATGDGCGLPSLAEPPRVRVTGVDGRLVTPPLDRLLLANRRCPLTAAKSSVVANTQRGWTGGSHVKTTVVSRASGALSGGTDLVEIWRARRSASVATARDRERLQTAPLGLTGRRRGSASGTHCSGRGPGVGSSPQLLDGGS